MQKVRRPRVRVGAEVVRRASLNDIGAVGVGPARGPVAEPLVVGVGDAGAIRRIAVSQSLAESLLVGGGDSGAALSSKRLSLPPGSPCPSCPSRGSEPLPADEKPGDDLCPRVFPFASSSFSPRNRGKASLLRFFAFRNGGNAAFPRFCHARNPGKASLPGFRNSRKEGKTLSPGFQSPGTRGKPPSLSCAPRETGGELPSPSSRLGKSGEKGFPSVSRRRSFSGGASPRCRETSRGFNDMPTDFAKTPMSLGEAPIGFGQPPIG